MELTLKQKLWLATRGGRSFKDILYVDEKPSVLMWKKGVYKPVHIPHDDSINIMVRSTGKIIDFSPDEA